jgi:hypothetical protein
MAAAIKDLMEFDAWDVRLSSSLITIIIVIRVIKVTIRVILVIRSVDVCTDACTPLLVSMVLV